MNSSTLVTMSVSIRASVSSMMRPVRVASRAGSDITRGRTVAIAGGS